MSEQILPNANDNATPGAAGTAVPAAASGGTGSPGAVTPRDPARPATVFTAADDLVNAAAALSPAQQLEILGHLGQVPVRVIAAKPASDLPNSYPAGQVSVMGVPAALGYGGWGTVWTHVHSDGGAGQTMRQVFVPSSNTSGTSVKTRYGLKSTAAGDTWSEWSENGGGGAALYQPQSLTAGQKATARANIGVLGGCVSMGPPAATRSENVARFHAKLAEAKAQNLPLLLEPGKTYEVNDSLLLSGVGTTVEFGKGASIVQLDPGKHGFVFDEASPPHSLRLIDPFVFGTGHATSTASGIYGRRANDGYLCSDIEITGGQAVGFQNGIELRNVAKLHTCDFDLMDNVTGYFLDKVDTYLIEVARVVGTPAAGGTIPGSRCFFFKDANFAGEVLMGEFGGVNLERFCEIEGNSVKAVFRGCNLERFESPQICTMRGSSGNVFDFRYGRVMPRVGSASTDAFLSIDAGGNAQPGVAVKSLSGWSPTGKRLVEVFGSSVDPRILGEKLLVRHVDARGGTELRKRMVVPGVRGYALSKGGLPVSAHAEGDTIFWESPGVGGDEWLRAPLAKLRDNRADSLRRCTTINEQHHQVIATSGRGSSGVGAKAVFTSVLPPKMLTSAGESFSLRLAGSTANNSNNKRIRVKLNGAVLFDSGDLGEGEKQWQLSFHVQADSGYEKWDAHLVTNDAALGTLMGSGDTSAANWYGNSPNAGTFVVETETDAAGDITYCNGKGEWLRTRPTIND